MERELLLLGVLRHGEMHGYQLHDFIEKNMAFCTDLKKPTAYFLLDRMQESGWVSVKEAREGNRPQKRIYKLTTKGETAFQEMLRENLSDFSAAKTGSDIGLAFIDTMPAEEAQQLLLRRRDAVTEQVVQFEQAPAHAGSYQLLIDHQLHYLRSELEWLNLVIRRVKAKARAQHV